MSAAVQILLEKADKGLAVPIEGLFAKHGKPYVYRLTSDGYRETPVKIVQRNEMMAAVSGGLKSGDTVACDRPPADMMAGAKERRK
jgi:multidrug efflux pump subunit AcrA (membrane-fusion protein)